MSHPALLDVNLLIALFDPDHVHHEPAHAWFGAHRFSAWATCSGRTTSLCATPTSSA